MAARQPVLAGVRPSADGTGGGIGRPLLVCRVERLRIRNTHRNGSDPTALGGSDVVRGCGSFLAALGVGCRRDKRTAKSPVISPRRTDVRAVPLRPAGHARPLPRVRDRSERKPRMSSAVLPPMTSAALLLADDRVPQHLVPHRPYDVAEHPPQPQPPDPPRARQRPSPADADVQPTRLWTDRFQPVRQHVRERRRGIGPGQVAKREPNSLPPPQHPADPHRAEHEVAVFYHQRPATADVDPRVEWVMRGRRRQVSQLAPRRRDRQGKRGDAVQATRPVAEICTTRCMRHRTEQQIGKTGENCFVVST
jgi:hypothetical protein